MKIEHLAIYVNNLEGVREFFQTYFQASANQLYHNQKTGFKSYFLSFQDGARLEIMTKPDMLDLPKEANRTGLAHFAMSLGSKEAIDALIQRLVLVITSVSTVHEQRVTATTNPSFWDLKIIRLN